VTENEKKTVDCELKTVNCRTRTLTTAEVTEPYRRKRAGQKIARARTRPKRKNRQETNSRKRERRI
jgi:hypothetical protein